MGIRSLVWLCSLLLVPALRAQSPYIYRVQFGEGPGQDAKAITEALSEWPVLESFELNTDGLPAKLISTVPLTEAGIQDRLLRYGHRVLWVHDLSDHGAANQALPLGQRFPVLYDTGDPGSDVEAYEITKRAWLEAHPGAMGEKSSPAHLIEEDEGHE